MSSSSSGTSVFRSHYLPRTRAGRIAVGLFLALLLLAEPPLLYLLANRIEPRLLGMSFLYVYLLAIYCAMIAVLLWARRRGL
jgi:hypothetical protein